MNLNWIRTFVAVVTKGSFAEAARELEISPAAVSKQIAHLESTVGVALLKRSTRMVALTEPGRLYYEQSQRILEEIMEAQALALQMQAEPQGKLKVLSGRYFAMHYLIPFMSELLTLYPKLDLDLQLVERMPDLEKENVDVLIGMSLSASGDVIQRRMLTTRYVCCASPQYFKKHGFIEKPSDLKQHRYITHSMRKPTDTLEFPNGLQVSLKPLMCVNDTEAMRQLAKDGLGVIKVHRYMVEKDLEKGALVECLEGYTKEEIPIWVAYRQQKHLPPKIRGFIDFMVQKCKG